MNKKRKIVDILSTSTTYFSSILAIIILFSIIGYVSIKGIPALSIELLTNNYQSETNIVKVVSSEKEFDDPHKENSYFSKKYGVSLIDSTTPEGDACVKIVYIAIDSPLRSSNIITDNSIHEVTNGEILGVLMGVNSIGLDVYSDQRTGAEKYASNLDSCTEISYLVCKTPGEGIRGSLITTLYLILLTLVISLPLGIGASIYLVEYAKEGKVKNIIITMIDMTSGVPSIIFGFCGALIFIPIVSKTTGTNSYSILAGALTMAIILLPTIIKTTCEALNVIPKSYTMASLALGASKTQTIFKVILPNAVPGILAAVLLSIGRIIGESAALIFVMGTEIKDNINIFSGSTSLSLHIWRITQNDNPNYDVACAISFIILVVVFVLSIIVKGITYKMNKGANYGK